MTMQNWKAKYWPVDFAGIKPRSLNLYLNRLSWLSLLPRRPTWVAVDNEFGDIQVPMKHFTNSVVIELFLFRLRHRHLACFCYGRFKKVTNADRTLNHIAEDRQLQRVPAVLFGAFRENELFHLDTWDPWESASVCPDMCLVGYFVLLLLLFI